MQVAADGAPGGLGPSTAGHGPHHSTSLRLVPTRQPCAGNRVTCLDVPWAQVAVPGLKGCGTPFSALCSDCTPVFSGIAQRLAPRWAALRAPGVSGATRPAAAGGCSLGMSVSYWSSRPLPRGQGPCSGGGRVPQRSLVPGAEPRVYGCKAPHCLPRDLEWDFVAVFSLKQRNVSLGTFLTLTGEGFGPPSALRLDGGLQHAGPSALSRSRQAGTVLTRHAAPCPPQLLLLSRLSRFWAFPGEPE